MQQHAIKLIYITIIIILFDCAVINVLCHIETICWHKSFNCKIEITNNMN